MVVLYIRDHKELGFSNQNITLKPASNLFYNSLAALANNDAFKITPNNFNKSIGNFVTE